MQSSKNTKQNRKVVGDTAPAEKSPVTESVSAARKTRPLQAKKADSESSSSAAAKSHRKAPTTRKIVDTLAAPVSVPAASVASAGEVARPEIKTASHEEIAKLAYSYYLERGGQHGYAEQDWLRAERELSKKAAAAGAGI